MVWSTSLVLAVLMEYQDGKIKYHRRAMGMVNWSLTKDSTIAFFIAVYSYNPCQPFTQSNCENVAACQSRRDLSIKGIYRIGPVSLAFATDETLAYSLGTQNSVQWKKVDNQEYPNILYTSGQRSLQIELKCKRSGAHQLDVYGYDDANLVYKMTLSSRCVCWNVCKGLKAILCCEALL